MTPIPLGILAASGFAGAPASDTYDLLASEILDSTQASVTFSSLGDYAEAYQHLQVRAVVRGDFSATTAINTILRFNADSGSNYAWHDIYGTGSSVISSGDDSQTYVLLRDSIPAANSTADAYGSHIVDILDFASTTKNTTVRSLHGEVVAAETRIVLSSGLWNNTNAVTSFEFSSNGNYVSGSRFSLYGYGKVSA